MSTELHETRTESARHGIGLCLSGGGYRAMLFHAGALWRLNETGWLRKLDFVSSVSGGSIAAGILGHVWKRLDFNDSNAAVNFVPEFLDHIRYLAGRSVDRNAVVLGAIRPGRTIGEQVAAAYRKHLFGDDTLQDLPEHPRFIITATNLQTGKLWRFSRPYMRDWTFPAIPSPTTGLAVAVAASSAFPPFLSPVDLPIGEADWALQSQPAPAVRLPVHVVLSDGGVYDNLGLEPVVKRCETVLVSDGGGQLARVDHVPHDWPRHLLRVLSVVDSQVRSLRKRALMAAFEAEEFRGAYWGIRSDISKYELSDSLYAPMELTQSLARIPTRLSKMPKNTQEQLINWGYAVCDAGLRRWVDPLLKPPTSYPYPETGFTL
ncbi:patatin-like phospholipase family protein [Streptomyces sp. NPDC001135]